MKYTLTLEVYVGYDDGAIVGVNDGGVKVVGLALGIAVGLHDGFKVGEEVILVETVTFRIRLLL